MPLGLARLQNPPRGIGAAITVAYDAVARVLSGLAQSGAEVIVTLDGADQATRPIADSSGRWSFSVSGLSNGSHTYAVRTAVSTSGSLTVGAPAPSAGGTLDFSDPANSGHIPGV